ncbi:TolC family protein [Aquimarina algicola]|uniref:TolC family protein n=1 Tax=Aquimarina algicola TaxID=2589995 RepID=A0A504J7U6_9FLAO|nr:TolC family protein [Aquimarina algicola]TPN86936.1 hypothetical protein FHK87_04855 [Aquimarina algicola]
MKKLFLFFALLSLSLTISAQKKSYQIGVLLETRNEMINTQLKKLQNEIKTVVGEDAIIIFNEKDILINDYKIDIAQKQYDQLINNDVDIILAFGVTYTKIIAQQKEHKKPTILFGAINKDFNTVDLPKEKSNIDNFTYLVEPESYRKDLERLKSLTNFKRVGIIIEKQFIDFLSVNNTFDTILKSLDAEYTLIPFESISDIESNLDDVDAVYLAGGFFMSDTDVKKLSDIFIEKKLPSFTINTTKQVEKGIMATNNPNRIFDQFIRRVSLTIERYINGTPLSEIPVAIDYKPQLTLNYNTAEAIGIPIKYSLINDTNFIGEFDNVLSEEKYSLVEAVNKALNKNLNLQASKKNVELSNQDVKTAKSNYLPNLTASATTNHVDPDVAALGFGQTPEFQTSGNLTLQQTIFSESANANITIQKNLLKAQQETLNAESLNTIFNVSNAYFNTLALKASAQIQKSNLDLTKKNYQIAEQNFEAGQSSKSDMLRFRSQMAQNTQTMIEAVNQLEQGFITLNQLLNNPVETKIDINDVTLDDGIFSEYQYEQLVGLLDDPTTREPFIEFLIQEAKNNSPELKAIGYNLDATERSIKLNGSGRFLPTVQLQGQYNTIFDRSGEGSDPQPGFTLPNNNYNIGVTMSIPIFNRTQTNINRQTSIIQKEQLSINRENTELTINTNIRNGILNVINQITNIRLSKVSEETAKEALELTQVSYSKGAVNVVQLIDAQNNYLNAQLASMTAVYTYLTSALQIERFIAHYFLLSSKEENNALTQRFLQYLNTKTK